MKPERGVDPRARGGLARALRRRGGTTRSLYKNRIDDVQFYVDLARKRGGPVLEYGIGNGRIALPVAPRHGVRVVGIDQSREMLADLGARASRGESGKYVRARRESPRRQVAEQAPRQALPAGHVPVQRGAAPVRAGRCRAVPGARSRAHLAYPAGRLRLRPVRAGLPGPASRSDARLQGAALPAPDDGRHRSLRRALRLRPRAAGALRVDGVRADGLTRSRAWMTAARAPAVLPAASGGAASLQRGSRSSKRRGGLSRRACSSARAT